jgi:hypothetical protein
VPRIRPRAAKNRQFSDRSRVLEPHRVPWEPEGETPSGYPTLLRAACATFWNPTPVLKPHILNYMAVNYVDVIYMCSIAFEYLFRRVDMTI